MELTEEQIKFLDEVCKPTNFFSKDGRRDYTGKWTLNENGELDVDGDVDMFNMGLTEIPVKFGTVRGYFDCSVNKLTSLEFVATSVGGEFYCWCNNLTNYFKNIKEEDFPHWSKLDWGNIINEYPFMINIGKKYFNRYDLKWYLLNFPQTKLYYKD